MHADYLESLGYYKMLRALVEEMYVSAGEKKVSLVVHSMGAPLTLHFLNNLVTQEWKDRYIHAFIPIAGAWSGGNQAVRALVSGISVVDLLKMLNPSIDPFSLLLARLGCSAVSKETVRSTVRTLESMSLLLPKPSVWGSEVLVSTPMRNYSANDYQALFSDIGYQLRDIRCTRGFRRSTMTSLHPTFLYIVSMEWTCRLRKDFNTTMDFLTRAQQ